MNLAHVKKFLYSLGVDVEKGIMDEERRWFRCSCPLAPWTHAGEDATPSFGVSIRDSFDETQSVFACFTCGSYWRDKNHWGLTEFVDYYTKITGNNISDAYLAALLGESVEPTQALLKTEKPLKKEHKDPLPQHFLDSDFPLLEDGMAALDFRCLGVYNYLTTFRGFNAKTLYKFNIRYSKKEATIALPLTKRNGSVYHMRSRVPRQEVKSIWTVDSKTSGRTDIIFPRITATGAMFGLENFDFTKSYAYMMEGEFDVMAMSERFGCKNVVATATSSITKSQAMSIFPYIRRLVLMYDADKAGALAVKRAMVFAEPFALSVEVIDFSLVGRKDPDDLKSQEELDYLLANPLAPKDFLKKYGVDKKFCKM